jgi:hypothetical protein
MPRPAGAAKDRSVNLHPSHLILIYRVISNAWPTDGLSNERTDIASDRDHQMLIEI